MPFSLSTFKKSCGMPSYPPERSVGNNFVNSSLIGKTDFSNIILVDETSAIEEGVLGTKLCLNFYKVEKFLEN